MNKFCCGFGHSDCLKTDEYELGELLNELINEYSVKTFLLSDFGNFDRIFFSCAKYLKKSHPNIKLILVKPYITKELSLNKEYYTTTYDEIIIPEVSANAYYKSAITICNKWIIEKSDFVVSNVYKNYGGAYEAIKYAKKIDKKIFNLSDK